VGRREKKLLVVLAAVAGLYLLSRTKAGMTATSNVTDLIARLITGHEGEVLTVYQDVAGFWTVGKGHLIKPTDTVRGEKLHPYGPIQRITKEESDAFFLQDTETARNAVANRVAVPLTVNQRAALVSLVFNIGTGAFGTSTLLRKLNAGDYKGAADQFLVWKKAGGADVPGLLRRRESERALFLS
jgi:lysozyme